MVIAIDGHSSCGKSTLAKDLAKRLDYTFVDSGAMYRAVTLFLIENTISLDDHTRVAEATRDLQIDLIQKDGQGTVWLNQRDVTTAIRLPKVAALVSPVATIGAVREQLVAQQRAMAKKSSLVMDGRDIGTVVFPDAEVKLFVTASIDERVRRRYQELKAKGVDGITTELVRDNLLERDHIDSTRTHSPLRRAEDAYLLDNTHLTRQEQLDVAVRLVDAAT